MATFLSITPPRFLLIPRRPSSSAAPPPSRPHLLLARPLLKSSLLGSSSFASAAYLIVTEEEEEEQEAAAVEEGSVAPSVPSEPEERVRGVEDADFRGCKACGREEIEKGCNGEGRIQGGIATVPGFGWWPIKAFRPCPGFVVSGGRYRRKGQSMDEVAFGRGEREMSSESIVKSSSRKKKRGSKSLN